MECPEFIGICNPNWKSQCLCFCAAGQSRRASSPDQTRAGWTSTNGRPNSQGKGTSGLFAGVQAKVPFRKHTDYWQPLKGKAKKQRGDEDNHPHWAFNPPFSRQALPEIPHAFPMLQWIPKLRPPTFLLSSRLTVPTVYWTFQLKHFPGISGWMCSKSSSLSSSSHPTHITIFTPLLVFFTQSLWMKPPSHCQFLLPPCNVPHSISHPPSSDCLLNLGQISWLFSSPTTGALIQALIFSTWVLQ